MGIYIFKWSVLKKFLIEDEEDPHSENDFGKNVIPAILNEGYRLFAYEFQGYWKDVGTISSLWEANMDLLGKNPAFNLYGEKGNRIYARNYAMPSSIIARESKNKNCFIAEGCEIYGTITHSIISTAARSPPAPSWRTALSCRTSTSSPAPSSATPSSARTAASAAAR